MAAGYHGYSRVSVLVWPDRLVLLIHIFVIKLRF